MLFVVLFPGVVVGWVLCVVVVVVVFGVVVVADANLVVLHASIISHSYPPYVHLLQ